MLSSNTNYGSCFRTWLAWTGTEGEGERATEECTVQPQKFFFAMNEGRRTHERPRTRPMPPPHAKPCASHQQDCKRSLSQRHIEDASCRSSGPWRSHRRCHSRCIHILCSGLLTQRAIRWRTCTFRGHFQMSRNAPSTERPTRVKLLERSFLLRRSACTRQRTCLLGQQDKPECDAPSHGFNAWIHLCGRQNGGHPIRPFHAFRTTYDTTAMHIR